MVQLEAISTEILERIVHFLGCNLATHIALSQTCRRLRDLYHHPDSETFWQYACFRAGFGRPKRRQALEDLAEEFPWRKLARILVNHELHCEITTCRNANACFGAYLPTSRVVPLLISSQNLKPINIEARLVIP